MSKTFSRIAIAVLAIAIFVPGLFAQTTLVSEDFEGTTWPPAGWTTGSVAGPDNWNFNTHWHPLGNPSNPTRSNYTGAGGKCADCDDDGNHPPSAHNDDNWLKTPDFDGSSYGEITLEYNICFRDMGSSEARIEVYNGTSWQAVATYPTNHGYPDGTRDTIHIGMYKNDAMAVRFVYDETSPGSHWYWYLEIDSVRIVGSGAATALDLELAGIIRPYDKEEPDKAFEPKCKVYNNTQDTVKAKVRCVIKDVATQQDVYENVHPNQQLYPGYTVVSFKNFTAEGGKKYEALFVVENDDDVDNSNNKRSKKFTTEMGVDVTPFEVVAPLDTQLNNFAPSAKYAERAGAETECELIYTIKDDSYNAIIKSDTVSHKFAANDTFTASFADVSLSNGSYTITFWAEVKNDNISHDPISKTFSYSGVVEAPELEKSVLTVSGNTVNFSLAEAGIVSIKVYDATGSVVSDFSGSYGAGQHSVSWNAAPGVYFIKLYTPEFSRTAKTVILN